MGTDSSNYLPIISLLVFSYIAYNKCQSIETIPLKFKFRLWKLLFALAIGLIYSNDITPTDIYNEIKMNNYL